MILHQRPLRTMCDTLSLTNSTFFTADTTNIFFPIDDFRYISIEKIIIPVLTLSPLTYLTYCTPTKCNLYFANSLAVAAVSEPALYRLLTFQVPNLMSLFHCLFRTKVSAHVRGLLYECFVTPYVFSASC